MKQIPHVDAENIDLPKWPGLLVVGEPVTKEQAAEICIRTCDLNSIYSNNKEWEWEVRDMFGLEEAYSEETNDKVEKQFKTIRLSYLDNHRIMSAWIGGPHGWCNWNGEIFTNVSNIGKWPSVEDVIQDWKAIARNFPFLNLKSQLLDKEICEENPSPLIEFHIQNGRVKCFKPNSLICSVDKDGPFKEYTVTANPDFEVGVDSLYLKWAILTTLTRLNSKKQNV